MFILRTRHRFNDTKNTASGRPVRRLNYPETMTLKGSVTKALNNAPLGKTYIKDLIDRVAFNTGGTVVSTDILDLFTKVFEVRGDNPLNGGIWIFRKGTDSSSADNVWDYVGGRGFAEIYLAFSGDLTYEQVKMPEEQKNVPRYESLLRHLVDPYKGGMTTIHELMHVAVKGHINIGVNSYAVGSDVHFADAAVDLAGDKPINYAAESNGYASKYWGERLHQACGYPSHITHKMTNYKLYKDIQGESK